MFFNFPAPPALGTRVQYRCGRVLTLVACDPYLRADGLPSFVLTWQDQYGEQGTTGLRSRDWTRQPKPLLVAK
jgi:hypothetical protein